VCYGPLTIVHGDSYKRVKGVLVGEPET